MLNTNIFKAVNSILVLAAVSITLTGCLPKKVPVEKTRTVSTVSMTLDANASSSETQDGITIKARAIHPDNIEQYASLLANVDYYWYRMFRDGTHVKNRDGSYATRSSTLKVSLLPLPAFEVKITNSTKHVLRFSNAVIAVEDDKGNSYDALAKSDLSDYLKESVQAHFRHNSKYKLGKGVDADLEAKLRNIRVLDNNLKVLPGKTIKAYVAINYGNYTTEEAKKFIMNNSQLTLGLYELPSEVNQAGKATKTTNFSFVYDIKVKDTVETYTVYQYK